jgi:adenylate cyclase
MVPRIASTRRPSLSVTLLSLIAILLIATVAAIVAVVRVSQSLSEADLQTRAGNLGALASRLALTVELSAAPPLLAEMRSQAARGRLNMDDEQRMAELVIDRLRFVPALDRLSYSSLATGRYIGAWRREDGTIVLNTSMPGVDEGRASEWEVTPDGRRTSVATPSTPPGYDPRQRAWFKQAISSDSIIWSEPFVMNLGRYGVAAAVAIRDPNTGALKGVFTADYFLESMTQYLTRLTRDTSRAQRPLVAFVTRDETLVAHAIVPPGNAVDHRIEIAIAASPIDLNDLEVGKAMPLAFTADGALHRGQVTAVSVIDGYELILLIAVREDEFFENVRRNQAIASAVGAAILLVSVILGYFFSQRISRPLRYIAQDLERIGRFEISDTSSPRSFVREIMVVSDAADRMKASLRSFARYVPRQLVQDVLASGREAKLGGENRVCTIYFTDIEGFTSISESLTPSALVDYLGDYLEAMTDVIQRHHGTVDKYIGDAIMALFNAPLDVPAHAAEACRAAIRSQERLTELGREWTAVGRPMFRTRIGLHTGELLVGNIGTPERFQFTVIGDAVNLASRLEGLNKVYGTHVMASQDLREAAGPGFEWRTLDRVAVVGRSGGTLVSELLGETGQVDSNVLAARDAYQRGLDRYLAGDFQQAIEEFGQAARLLPGDRAATVLAARAQDYLDSPPGDWDGIYRAESK